MKTARLVLAFLIIVVVFSGVLTLGVAAATKPMTVPNSPAILSVDSERVELKKSGSDNWIVVNEDTVIGVGDSVWTNTTGGATITFFDQGVIRLDADTTIVIEQAAFDAANPDTFQGSIFMESGQIWSRMFDFISPDSSYEVRTASTVATVRGTIFDVWQRGNMSGVYVDEHTVYVVNNGQDKIVEQGDFMLMDPKADTLMDVYQTMDADMQAWVARNRELDAQYDARMAAELATYVPTPGPMTVLAEKIRLSLSSNDDELAARFGVKQDMYDRWQILSGDQPTTPADPTLANVDETVSGDGLGCDALERAELARWKCYELPEAYEVVYSPEWDTDGRGDAGVFVAGDSRIFADYSPPQFMSDEMKASFQKGGAELVLSERREALCSQTDVCGQEVDSMPELFAGETVTVTKYRVAGLGLDNKQGYLDEYITAVDVDGVYYQMRLEVPSTVSTKEHYERLDDFVTMLNTFKAL
jgi:hypothetical protein